MTASSSGGGSGIHHRSDNWESAVEGQSSAKTLSSSTPEPLSSSIYTDRDASLDTAPSQDRSASTRKRWSAVKVSAKLAGAHRKAKEDDGSAFDAEGMSDLAGNRSSGAYLEQWNSIAHFLDEDEEDVQSRDHQRISRKRERTNRSQMDADDMNHASLTEEPESMVSSNLDEIPRQENPLSYASGTKLLDTDTESTGDEAYDTCTETGEGKASQSQLSSQVKSFLQRRPSPFSKTVFKCVLAYFVASLFTYSPYLSHRMAIMLPNHNHSDKVPISNLHLIATVSVYFHPGRSMGSMVEASIYAMAGFLYSVFLGIASMLLAVFLHDNDLPLFSNFLTVFVFVGLGMTLVGYAKVKIGRPNFNTACSLIGVITFTVIVSEGSAHLGRFSAEKIWQVTLVVFVGTLISNIVCFSIWPTSACTSLQVDIQRNLESFSTLLKVLTKTFLLDDMKEFNIRSHRIKEAIEDHHASFVSLKKNLAEAKLEVPFDVRIRGRVSSYVRVVDSLNVLAQHLGGLRSSCGLQHEMILAQRAKGKLASDDKDDDLPAVSSINGSNDSTARGGGDFEDQSTAFRQFLTSVGPHMRSLVFTCSRTLKSLTTAFSTANAEQKEGDFANSFDALTFDVSAALKRFQHEQTVAIKRLYTMESADGLYVPGEDSKTTSYRSDEDINLIFYFVFLLEEFSEELNILVKACDTIQLEEQMIQESRKRAWWKQFISPFSISRARDLRRSRYKKAGQENTFAKTVKGLFVASTPCINLPSTRAHQENTKQTPLAMTTRDRLYRHIWRLGLFLKEPDTKFAIKAGLGAAVLASPAFFKSTRHLFTAYKGQWALVSYMVVLSPTVGQSNQMSIHRSLGTLLGAAAAMAAYWLFPDNNVALPIFGALFSIPCFCWIIGKPQLASSGRFVLLTFNLTALYSYNIRKVGIEVDEIAFHRTVAVIVGVAWATVLNHLIWPFEARRELARGLSDLLFKLGFLYQQVALSYSSADELPVNQKINSDQGSLEEQPLLPPTNPKKEEERLLELSLQVHLIKLEGLLNLTKHEPRLKGPFPVDTYKQFLGCCQNILDLLHTMNQVTSRPDWHTQVRRDFIIPIDQAGLRREMVGNVGLFFWILASAFHLKTPLPPFLPPAETSRLQVLHAIRQLPVVKKRAIHGSSEYLLYFAYALSMKDLIHQLELIGKLAQSSFGVLGGDVESFEEQFRVNPQSVVYPDCSSSSNSNHKAL